MRVETMEKINKICDEQGVQLVDVEDIYEGTCKVRDRLVMKCTKCGAIYTSRVDRFMVRTYKDLCEPCIRAQYKRTVQRPRKIDRLYTTLESYGLKILTQRDSYYKKKWKMYPEDYPLEVETEYGTIITLTFFKFMTDKDYYLDIIKTDYDSLKKENETKRQCKTRLHLDTLGVEYKEGYRVTDYRGKEHPLVFDYCINHTKIYGRLLIDIEKRATEKNALDMKEIEKEQRVKEYYCLNQGIPYLRIPYDFFINSIAYKKAISDFIHINKN